MSVVDSTAAAIEAAASERDQLRAEVDRLTKFAIAEFRKGYDQAVIEIRDHFYKRGDRDVAAEVEKIWKVAFEPRERKQ